MESSDNAFEMRLLIVLSADTSNIAIFSCLSIFSDIFLIARYPTTRSNPIAVVTASIPITARAATIAEKSPTPVIPHPIAVTPKQLSITPIILTPLLYFLLSRFAYLSLRLVFPVYHQFFKTIYMSIISIKFNNFNVKCI